MTLPSVLADLTASLNALEQHLIGFVVSKTSMSGATDFTFNDECFLEGLLSRIWQAWGLFCRQCVVHSCLGSTTSKGMVLSAVAGAASEAHVSGAAVRAKN